MCRKAHGSGRSTPENTTLLVQRDRTRQDRVKAQHFRPPLALTFGDGLGNSAGDRGVDIGLVRDVGVWESGEGSPLQGIPRARSIPAIRKKSPRWFVNTVCPRILHSAGLINSPDVSVDTLAARSRVRLAGDSPLAGLVGELVADLEVYREDVVGPKSDLRLRVLGPAAGRCRPHGVPQRVERAFSLLQHVRRITQLAALVHQDSRRLPCRLRPASYCHWQHRAAVEMRPNTVGQVCVAPRAPVRTDIAAPRDDRSPLRTLVGRRCR